MTDNNNSQLQLEETTITDNNNSQLQLKDTAMTDNNNSQLKRTFTETKPIKAYRSLPNPNKQTYSDEYLRQRHQQRYPDTDFDDYADYMRNKKEYTALDFERDKQLNLLKQSYTEEQLESIRSQGSISAIDFVLESNRSKNRQESINRTIEKYNNGVTLTKEELEELDDERRYITNVQLRGVAMTGELSASVIENIKHNARSTVQKILIDYGLDATLKIGGIVAGGYFAGPPGAVAGAKVASVVGAFAEAKLQTLMMPDKIKAREIELINQTSLGVTDKGELIINKLTQAEKEFMKKRAETEVYNENLSETLIDAITDMIPGGSLIPSKVKNSIVFKYAQKINKAIKVPGTTLSSFLNEHIEEIFSDVKNYIDGVSEKESISEIVKD